MSTAETENGNTNGQCHYDSVDYAFGRGSDARIAGKKWNRNPYLPGTSQSINWSRGWRHVDKHWGEKVEGRWLFMSLPKLATATPDDQ